MGLLPSKSSWYEFGRKARLAPEVPKLLSFSRYSPGRLCERAAEHWGNLPALLFQDQRFTWREVDGHANQWAHWFRRRDIAQGDVVALMFDNRPDFIFATLGLSKLGAVSALVNTNLVGKPLIHAIETASAKLFVGGGEHLGAIEAVAGQLGRVPIVIHSEGLACDTALPVIDREVAASSFARPPGLPVPHGRDPAQYIYTSGTTGLPKAARIPNARVLGAAAMFGRVMFDCGPGDVLYIVLPLYHSNAQWMGWSSCLLTGATMALRRKFSASQFWEDVRRYDATHFLYIGEICRYLTNAPAQPGERNHRLRMGVGNGLRADVWKTFQERFKIPLLREFYGATEGNAILTNVEGRPGMIGRLAPVHHLIACDPMTGEPERGPNGLCKPVKEGQTGLFVALISPVTRFDGYLDTAASRKKIIRDVRWRGDAWFNSGDLMTLHEDSWVSFADRVGDTFRWKGENVSTYEVAEVLNGAPGVLQSNVYGVTVSGAEGRAGMASLVVDDRFQLDAFAAYVVKALPGFQRPWFIRLQPEVEQTATFKQKKVDSREEGYDPTRCKDPLYFLEGSHYTPIDGPTWQRLRSGEIGPR